MKYVDFKNKVKVGDWVSVRAAGVQESGTVREVVTLRGRPTQVRVKGDYWHYQWIIEHQPGEPV